MKTRMKQHHVRSAKLTNKSGPSIQSLCQNSHMSFDEGAFLNAEDAEAIAELRKGQTFSAFLCEKLCALCVKIGFDNHPFLILTQNLRRWERRVIVIIMSLAITATIATAQTSSQPKPTPTPRRPLPKPVAGTRGFDQYAKRDASARLIAAAGTRVIIDPGDFYSKGEANYKAGKYEEAVKDLTQAVKLSPDWDDPHYVLALSLTELGRLKEAIEEFKQAAKVAIKDEPKILAYYNMGNAYADLGQYKEAIEAYQKAIQINAASLEPQKLSKPHNNLGLAYAASGQLTEAVAEFNQAVELRPDYAEARYNLGVAYVQLGRKHDAVEQQQILLKLKSELASNLDALIKK